MKRLLIIIMSFSLLCGTALAADYDGDKKSDEIAAHGGSVATTTRIFIQDPADTDIVTYATAQEIATAVLGTSYDTAAELGAAFDARALESVIGDAIEADDFELSGTTLQLVAQIPHLDVAETISGNWVNTANPWADNEVIDALTISGGTVNNSVIGGSTAAAITGTTVKANTSFILEGGDNDTTLIAGTPSEAVTYTLPAADGISGQYLYTDGSGVLAFGDPSGSGDITAVGDVASGEAFTADGGGNVLYFEGTSANANEIALTGANPAADVVVTIPATTGTLLLETGTGSSLTAVDAITGDSATAFFDAGAIETNYGGTGADLSAVTGIMGMNAGSYVDVDTAAELETYAGLGAYASDILGAADSDALVTLLGLVAGDIPDLSATYEAVDAEILRADTADTISADFEWQDGIAQSFGNDNDVEIAYDETTDDRLEMSANRATDIELYMANAGAGDFDLRVGGTIYAAAFETTAASGDSYLLLYNNASISPTASAYQLYYEGGNLVSVENGAEKEVLNATDSFTLTGTSWDFSGVTNFLVPTAAADASGEISISAGNQLKWHDGAKVVTIDTTTTTDNYVLKYDNATATFNLEEDATGGSPTIDSVGDATADATITFDAGEEMSWQYTGAFTTGSQFLVQQQTGNPTGGTLFQVSAADTDVTPFNITHNGEDLTVAYSASNTMAIGTTTGVSLIDTGGIGIGVGSLDVSDANITNVGSISLDSIAADGSTVTLTNGAIIADAQTLTFDESAADPNDADVTMGAADGVLTIAAANGANNENLTLDFDATADQVAVGTGTGVADLNFGSINLVTTGYVDSGTRLVETTTDTDVTVDGSSGIYINNHASTINYTLPADPETAGGDSKVFVFRNRQANAITITPAAGDVIELDGADETAAETIVSTGAIGDMATLVGFDDGGTDRWIVFSTNGTWDGGTD